MNAKSSEKKSSVQTVVITLIPPVLLIGVFTYWLLNSSLPVVPAALCGLLALLISALMIRTSCSFLGMIRTDAGSDEIFGIRRTRSNSSTLRHPILALILLAAFSRIIYFIAVYAVHTAYSGYGGGIFQMSALWNPPYSQGNSALNISNTWYAVPDFPNASYLPLFPLYPLLVSGLNLLTGNRFLAGLILSFLFFILSAVALYKLVLIDHGNSDAFRAVRYLCILPPTFLLNLPAADVLFLFLSIVTLIFARRRNYFAAAVSGAFTACTSLAGVLLFVPLFIELMMDGYAFLVWPYLGIRGYMESYSGYDPVYIIAHSAHFWVQELTDKGILPTIENLFSNGQAETMAYPSEAEVSHYLAQIIPTALRKYALRCGSRVQC